MKRQLLFCGLAAFVLTLAFSFWHERRDDAKPRAASELHVNRALAGVPASNPFSSAPATTPTDAASSQTAASEVSPAVPPSQPMQSAASEIAGADNDASLARRDRDVERGSRSH